MGSLVALAVGLVIGHFLRLPFRPEKVEPTDRASVDRIDEKSSQELRNLQHELANAKAMITEQKTQIADLKNALDEQRKTQSAAVIERTLDIVDQLGIGVFGKNLTLTPQIVKALQITDAEKTLIETTFRQYKDEVRTFEIENIELVSKEGITESYRIPAFPEIGSRIRDELTAQTTRILGEARSEFFLKRAKKALDGAFNYFGEMERYIIVNPTDLKHDRTGEHPDIMYITEGFEDSSGKVFNHHYIGFMSGDIPKHLRHLFDTEQ